MDGYIALFVALVLILVVLLVLIANLKIVSQAQVYVIERLGSYLTTWDTGLHFLIPFIDRVAKRVSLKENVVDFPPQPVITKDNVTMQIDTIVFYLVSDPKMFTYGIDRPISAIENLTATTLRNIIGDLDLDATLTSRDVINSRITSILDEATDKWGIKVTRVELKNIMPPREIQDAMEKQMKAERERRESILQAEGRKKSQILVAEGEKQSQILKAEAEKETAILLAEAEKEKQIREAEGQAQAIMMVQKANADALKLLSEADPSMKVLTLKSYEALTEVANGRSTKIIIPSEIQNLAGLVTSLKEVAEDDVPAKK